ncbi:MAG: hypothetical protein AAFN50_12960 [Pseudomonadota bacterium]
MSFEEKSAWGSLVGLLLVSGWYFPKAAYLASTSESSAPLIAISVGWIVAMIIILSVYHGVIALWGYDTDERDRMIELKAERIASHVFSVLLLIVVGQIMAEYFKPDAESVTALTVGVAILLAMAIAEAVKYAAQIVYYRVGA